MIFPRLISIFLLLIVPSFGMIQVSGQRHDKLLFDNLSVKDGLSQLSVLAIFKDSEGYMWFGTRNGLNRYNGYVFDRFLYDQDDSLSISDNYIKNIGEDSDGNLWIGTSNGLNRFDKNSRTFERYYLNQTDESGYGNTVRALCISKLNGDVLVGGFSGLWKLDRTRNTLAPVPGVHGRIDDIVENGNRIFVCGKNGISVMTCSGETVYAGLDPFSSVSDSGETNVLFFGQDDRIWAASPSGLAELDRNTLKARKLYAAETIALSSRNGITDIAGLSDGRLVLGMDNGLWFFDPDTDMLSNAGDFPGCNLPERNMSVESLFIDNEGILWIGTYSGGVFHTNPYLDRFGHYDPEQSGIALGPIGPITEYDGRIWMGTEVGGLLSFDPDTDSTMVYPCPAPAGETYDANNVKSLLVSGDTLFVGLYSGGLYTFNLEEMKYTGHYGGREMKAIYSISESPSGNILLGTFGTPALKHFDRGKIEDITLPANMEVPMLQITSMIADSNALYVGTRQNGLFEVRKDSVIHHIGGNIIGRKVYTLVKDHNGNILTGTLDNGLAIFDPRTGSVRKSPGFEDGMICSIVEDRNDDIYVITEDGISLLDSLYNIKYTYGRSSGIPVQEFSAGSAYVSQDNTIYLGGNNGFIKFNPSNLDKNSAVPPVRIKNVFINGRPADCFPAGKDGIEIAYDEANIAIEYNSLNFIYPELNQYACMLEGIDDGWNYVGTSNRISYAKLPPGKYVFRVRGSNNDNIWNPEGASLAIRVKPPFYRSVYAILFYTIFLSVVAYILFSYYVARQKLRQQAFQKEQEQKFWDAKMELFTNFSHEFRTPLTLIQAPVEEVVMSNDPARMNLSAFRLIYDNVNRLLLLVNQLMTFRKQESGKLKLHVSQGDISGFAREMVVAFSILAEKRHVDLRIDSGSISSDIWYDRSLLERVLMNILSNAFKYVPDKGRVVMKLDMLPQDSICAMEHKRTSLYDGAEEYIRISIENNGPGLEDAELERIFTPFYQSSSGKAGGTGLGLALAKGIVESHHGEIFAENIPEGGIRFIIILPAGNSHFSEEEIVRDYHSSEDMASYLQADKFDTQEIAIEEDAMNQGSSGKPVILIVEDNFELRKYVSTRLRKYYKVIEASNGSEGLHIAISEVPALILSDIMMPVMDGLQMSRALKSDNRTSHIPIILLTARSLVLQMKEGLELGAEDYITKPFSMNMLIMKIRNIISSRENLKKLYGHELSLESIGVELSSGEDRFLQKLNETVRENISDPDFDISSFCDKIGMSRASLYRKVQSAANMSPSKYVQTIRLHIAVKMLEETDMPILEIMDRIGMTNQAHFSSLFKKQYGKSPSQFRKDLRTGIKRDPDIIK